MRFRFFIGIFCVFMTLKAAAQSVDLGSWNILNFKYNQSAQWSFFAEGQIRSLRFYDHFHYYEWKGGFNYKWHKSAVFTLGTGSYQTYKEGGDFVRPKNNDEWRLWPQMVLTQDIGAFKVEQRYRAEMRWTSNGYRNRFRYRFGLSYPFGKPRQGQKPYQISASNELFFTDKEPYFERNRLQMAFSYRLNPNLNLQVGYLHQFDYKINDETGRDFLVLGLYYEISRSALLKNLQNIALPDN